MKSIGRKLQLLGAVILTALCGDASWSAAQWQFSGVQRVVAVADIHGAHSAFVRVLQQSGVIDSGSRWTGGETHLVIVGDVLDRGADSRRSLDLIMSLQADAAAAEGGVHLALGNHELMNLTGDLRYVSAGEYAAFSDDESPQIREAAFSRFAAASIERAENAATRTEFDERYPQGYFAHRAAFAADGIYGQWLLEQPLLVAVNDTGFVHGGLSALAAELGGEELNSQLGQQVRDYVLALEELTENGVLESTDDFYDHPDIITRFADRVAAGETTWPEDAEATSARLSELNRGMVFASDSPLWYRGSVGCSALIEKDRLTSALSSIGLSRVVIGHTPTSSSRVLSRLDGAVLRIDTGMLRDYYGGRAAALIIEPGDLSVVYEDSDEILEPAVQPRRVGLPQGELTAEELEAALLSAEIVRYVEDPATGQTLVTLTSGDTQLAAVFAEGRRGVVPEVAAYRLDRMLGLDMVPVAVPREIDGDLGSLQIVPSRVLNELQRTEQGLGGSAWCPLRDQFQAMYVFDSLILNEGRLPERMRYSVDNFQLILVGHGDALGTGRGRPAYLRDATLEIGTAWRDALESLDEDGLTDALGDVLDRRRIRSLLQRRDALLGQD